MALHHPMAMSLCKGHKVTKDESKPKHSCPHGRLTECNQVYQVHAGCYLRSVGGYAPYKLTCYEGPEIHQEKGGGTYLCQEEEREELSYVLAAMRKAAAKKD